MSSIFDRSGVRHKKDKRKDQPALVISAPLGDVRHVSHIGRDGADFGEEHLFVSIENSFIVESYSSNSRRHMFHVQVFKKMRKISFSSLARSR